MAELDPSTGGNPKESAILRLIQERIAAKLDQIEKERQAHDSFLSDLKTEIDGLLEVGTNINKELEEAEAHAKTSQEKIKPGSLDMKIDVDDAAGRNITAPQSTREVKTGLLGKNPAADSKNRRMSHQGKSDKPTSLNDIAEEQKKDAGQKPGKKPAIPTQTKPTKTDGKAVGTKAATETKKGQDATKSAPEEEKKEHTEPTETADSNVEKTPEQAAIDEAHAPLKTLTKAILTEAANLSSPPQQVLKVFEAALLALGEKSQTWITGQKLAKTADFSKKLTEVKAEAISDKNWKKIKQILGEDGMGVEALGKKNAAAKHIGQWLHALVKVRELIKGPEEEKIEEHNEGEKKEAAEEKKENTETAESGVPDSEKTPEQIVTDSLKALNKKNVGEALALANPPAQIIKVFEAILTALGEKSQTWITAKKLNPADLSKKLGEVKPEAITTKHYKKIKQILAEDGMDAVNIAKKNAASKFLVQWLQATITIREQIKGTEEDKADEHNADKAPSKTEIPEEEKKEEAPAADSNVEKTPEQAAIDEAHAPLKTLTKAILTEAANLSSPPQQVLKVFEAALLALGEKSQTWITGQKLAKTADFSKKLTEVKAEAISDKNWKKIKQILGEDGMGVEALGKKNAAAKHIGQWLHALVKVRELIKGPEEATEEHAGEGEGEAKTETKTETKPVKKPPTTGPKKDDKKEDKKEGEDKGKDAAEKKPAVPKAGTKATTTTKAGDKEEKKDEKKDEKKATTGDKTTEAKETKKPELHHATPELKTIIESIHEKDITMLRKLKTPSPAAVSAFQTVTLLTQGKELQWVDISKTIIHDIATLYKILDVDVSTLTQKNVEAANKKLSDKTLEAGTQKAGGGAHEIYKWAKAVVKLAQENKEEKKQEEPKEQPKEEPKEEPKAEPEHKEPEHKQEEAPSAAEEKPAEAETKAEENHEEKPDEEEQAQPTQEPAQEPVEEAAQEEPVQEPAQEEAQVEEHKQDEQEQEKAEEAPVQEETHANGDHAEAHNAEAENKVEEAHGGNGAVENGEGDYKEIAGELSGVLGHDVSGEIQNGNVKEYVHSKIQQAEDEAKAAEKQNEDFRKENVSENPEKKAYEIKQSTKEFIQMVQQEWITELKGNENWDEKIYQILALLFLVQGNPDVPEVSDHAALRSYSIARLEKEEADLGGYLMGVEKNLDLSTERKVRIQEFLRDKTAILNPSSFDGVDALCGVISFLMKEACEYLGVIPVELAKKAAAKEKIYLLNQEKIDYYMQRKNKLSEIADKHGISQ